MNDAITVLQWQPRDPPKRQITYDNLEIEERLAAQFSGYTWEQYQTLPGADWWIDPEAGGDSKASVIVFYRVAKRIEYIQNEPTK